MRPRLPLFVLGVFGAWAAASAEPTSAWAISNGAAWQDGASTWSWSNEGSRGSFPPWPRLPLRALPGGRVHLACGEDGGWVTVTNRLRLAVLSASPTRGTALFDALVRARAADPLNLDGFVGRGSGAFGVRGWIERTAADEGAALVFLDETLLRADSASLEFANRSRLPWAAFDRLGERLVWVVSADAPSSFFASRLAVRQTVLPIPPSAVEGLPERVGGFFASNAGLAPEAPFLRVSDLAAALNAPQGDPASGAALLRIWRWVPPSRTERVESADDVEVRRVPGREVSFTRNFVAYRAKEPDRIERTVRGVILRTNVILTPGRFEEIP